MNESSPGQLQIVVRALYDLQILFCALLLGPAEFVAEARRVQSMLGGVMRQVGFMAAAAHYAFHHNMERLADDHANARLIAEAIAENPGLDIDLEAVQTNIIYFAVRAGESAAAKLVADLEQEGVKAWNLGSLVRLVTSLNVSRRDCEYAAVKINQLLG